MVNTIGENLISCISMRHQIGFYNDIIKITLNIKIKYFQTIHTYILEPVLMRHHIVVHIQLQDQKFQNGTAY